MPRVRPPDRIDQLAEAATRVFTEKGYRALMSDVAAEMGVSQGLLYTYVESKEALFHLVVERLAGLSDASPDLPIPTPLPGETERLISKALRQGLSMPALEEALDRRSVRDARGELAGIVRELYRSIHDSRRLLRLVERAAVDIPELSDRFYRQGRRPFVGRLATYIERRAASGHFRPVPDPPTAARILVETASWFGNHRYGDADAASFDDDLVEETVVDMLTASLIKGGR